MEMALTGDLDRSPSGPHELGLVNRLAEPGEALDAALELAEAIAANGPLALAATKRILTESVDWPDAEFFARQEEIAAPVRDSEDAREGATRSPRSARRCGRALGVAEARASARKPSPVAPVTS